MGSSRTLAVLSDIHYAGEAERARGPDYEFQAAPGPLLRFLLRRYRQHLWLRDPLSHNHLLPAALERVRGVDWLIANGDYTCDTAFVGASDPAARESIRECVGILRRQQGAQLHLNIGDHELGKKSFFGNRGGMRVESWHRVTRDLCLPPVWEQQLGRYHLVGVASSVVGLPVFANDVLEEESALWQSIREQHLAEIRQTFARVPAGHRMLLFCHDPTALPWLAREPVVKERLPQIEQTIIGHLHSPLILWQSRLLSGMPRIRFLGTTVARMSGALREARSWRPFKVRLCPSLAGVELLKDGGFLTAELDEDARHPVRWTRHRLPRTP
jgi:hypothetical protein